MNDGRKYLISNAWLRNDFFLSYIPYGLPAYQKLGPGMVRYKWGEAGRSRLRMIDMRANLANTLIRRRSCKI